MVLNQEREEQELDGSKSGEEKSLMVLNQERSKSLMVLIRRGARA